MLLTDILHAQLKGKVIRMHNHDNQDLHVDGVYRYDQETINIAGWLISDNGERERAYTVIAASLYFEFTIISVGI